MNELRTPLKNVRGLGSAKDGTHHFVVQRITAIALIPLTLWLLWLVLRFVHADYATARALLAQPLHATLFAAFAVALFWHAQLGLQVVIEDYVHTRWLELTLQIAVKLAAWIGALASVLGILRLALGTA